MSPAGGGGRGGGPAAPGGRWPGPPRAGRGGDVTPSPSKLLAIEGLRKEYAVRRGALKRRVGTLRALDGVDLEVAAGECVALVGESGSGKTTLGRCAVRLIEPTAGRVVFAGEAPAQLARRRLPGPRPRVPTGVPGSVR